MELTMELISFYIVAFQYNEFIENNVLHGNFIIEQLSNTGNRKTFLKQIDTLLNQNFFKNNFFAEDDYLYRGKSLRINQVFR